MEVRSSETHQTESLDSQKNQLQQEKQSKSQPMEKLLQRDDVVIREFGDTGMMSGLSYYVTIETSNNDIFTKLTEEAM